MEHRTSAELTCLANVIRPHDLSRKKRLERWALVLEKSKGTRLRTLREVEHKPRNERSDMSIANSPLTVAFEDPVLRSAGLASDRFGEVARFFGLSHRRLHELVCHCHFGDTVAAEVVALRVRRLANQATSFAVAVALLMGIILLSMAFESLSSRSQLTLCGAGASGAPWTNCEVGGRVKG